MSTQDLRRRYLQQADSTEIAEILESAFNEDDACQSRFDAIGFDQFCPENKPEDVRAAWAAYCAYHRELACPYTDIEIELSNKNIEALFRAANMEDFLDDEEDQRGDYR